MIISFEANNIEYRVDLSNGYDISMPIDPNTEGPNCFYAERPKFKPYRSGDFVASVKEGGAVNSYDVTFNPHGNGTHTECQGHITKAWEKITDVPADSHFLAKLITVTPEEKGDDLVITKEKLKPLLSYTTAKALVIRTQPNLRSAKSKDYSGKNPAYLSEAAMAYIVEIGIDHLLVDLPSVDKEDDGGKVAGHKAFWKLPNPGGREHATITEMVYIDDMIKDGDYLLNLQRASFLLDCAPSRPILYKIL
jgi:kynurenine formamidase